MPLTAGPWLQGDSPTDAFLHRPAAGAEAGAAETAEAEAAFALDAGQLEQERFLWND